MMHWSFIILSFLLVIATCLISCAEDGPEVADLIAMWEKRTEHGSVGFANSRRTKVVAKDEPDADRQTNSEDTNPLPVDLCKDSSIDAITRTEDGSVYVFKGEYYWQLNDTELVSKYPAKIADGWPGLPNNLDTAFLWPGGRTYFVKGDEYWRFENRVQAPGYPKKLWRGFPMTPTGMNAVIYSETLQPRTKRTTYFFKGAQYWEFDMSMEQVHHWRSKYIQKDWSGISESGIDAAFTDKDGRTFVFKGNQYYRLAANSMEVDQWVRIPYPRSTAVWWFGCELGDK